MTPDEAKRKLAEMLASRDDEKKGNEIKARAFYINLAGDKTGYEYAKTRIASK